MFVRDLEEMPFDKMFPVNGSEELCHATGREVCFDEANSQEPGNWWNEYEDSEGEMHYGR